MIRPTNYKVAFAHLTSRVKQALVAIMSVTFGISIYIFINGFMTGVNDIQTELAFSTLAHIHIYNDLPEDRSNLLVNHPSHKRKLVNLRNAQIIQYTDGIKNADQIVKAVSQFPEVTRVTTQINMNVFFRNGATKVNGLLAGVNAAKEDELFGIADSMVKGSWRELDHRGDGIILGVGLAKKLSVKMNDIVMANTADGIDRNFRIIGLLETSLASVDNSKAYVRINTSRQLISQNRSYATDVQINIKDYNTAKDVARKMELYVNYKVESWIEANGQLEAGNMLRGYLAMAVSFTILLVAGFGIYNIMNMTVNEKIKEIAILKAMGFEGGDIVQIFLTQSLIIGLIGGIIGVIFGGIVSYAINSVPFEIATLKNLPMAYRISDYLSAPGFGFLTTFVAGYLPAKNASKVDPVEIIRG
ncbi:MAG: FtsX-like permease family protein [Bacteroidota bacterium]